MATMDHHFFFDKCEWFTHEFSVPREVHYASRMMFSKLPFALWLEEEECSRKSHFEISIKMMIFFLQWLLVEERLDWEEEVDKHSHLDEKLGTHKKKVDYETERKVILGSIRAALVRPPLPTPHSIGATCEINPHS